MRCAYHPAYEVPLAPGHPFPMSKYPLLKALLLDEGLIDPADLVRPESIDPESLALVHTPEYLGKLASSSLSAAEIRRIGLPWSDALWQRSLMACGGTLLAANLALAEGLAANLAGGTHHAFADHGEGFCVLNDVAVAIARLRVDQRLKRALVVDLDVHQGNGTAAIFADVPEVFTFSMHGERNYPVRKMQSSLDVALPDGAGDDRYLGELQQHLPQVLERARPQLAFYLAGVDVLAGDRYGRLQLSETGLAARDAAVLEQLRDAGVPVAIVLGGGYAASRERTASLHVHVFRAAIACERRSAAPTPG